jgi:hypothetical protein
MLLLVALGETFPVRAPGRTWQVHRADFWQVAWRFAFVAAAGCTACSVPDTGPVQN